MTISPTLIPKSKFWLRSYAEEYQRNNGTPKCDRNSRYSIVPCKVLDVKPYTPSKPVKDGMINLYDIEVDKVHRYCAGDVVVSNSSLDVQATLAHGAYEVLKDAMVIRGSKNEEYFKALKMGRTPPEPEVPFIYNKFLNTLKAGGINIADKGDTLSLLPMTDKDVDVLGKGSITSSKMIDKDFEPEPGGLFDVGKTGGMAGNKWSKIDLNEPMPNPVMEEPVRRLLGLTVNQMRDVLSGKGSINGISGGRGLTEALKGIDIEAELVKQTDRAKTLRGANRDNAIKVIGYLSAAKKQGVHPSNWVITKVPVLPPKFRPIARMGDMPLVADLNQLYADLIEQNNNIRDLRKDLPETELEDEKLSLYDAVSAAYGLGDPITPEGQSKRLKGAIRQLIGTNPKSGLVQSKLFSKQVSGVGRGVVAPDPNLDMDHIGIPEDSAWVMYKDFVRRRLVRRGYPVIKATEMVEKRDPTAREMLESEMQSRPVIVDRAPTWHKFNLLAFYPHMVDGNVIRVSPLVTKGFNMDFNGDSVICQYIKYIYDGVLYEKSLDDIVRTFICSSYDEDRALELFGVTTTVFDCRGEHKMYVLGLDGDNKVSWQRVTAISIHTSHADECSRVCTDTGMDAVFTSHHNFVGLDATCAMVPIKTTQLRVGSLVPYAFGLTLPQDSQCDPESPTKFDLTYNAGIWFGHYLADGSVTGRADTVSHASISSGLLSVLELEGDTNVMRGVKGWYEGNHHSVRWTDKDWAAYMVSQFGYGAANKHMAPWMFSAPSEFRRGLLVGYLLGEGSVADNNTGKRVTTANIRVECTSRHLLLQMRELLAGMGLSSKIGKGKPNRINHRGRACHETYVWLINTHDFLDARLSFPVCDKSEQFVSVVRPLIKHSVDTVPVPRCVVELIDARGKSLQGGKGRSLRGTLVRPLVNANNEYASYTPDRKQYATVRSRGYCTREYARKMIVGYGLQEMHDLIMDRWIAVVENVNLRWDIITCMEPTERPLVTYDFSVEGKEVFSIDGGFITHNTANFHVPVSDKASDEAKAKMLPSKNLFSLTDLQSARHTPSMEMSLGLYQMTQGMNKNPVHKFASMQEARKAYARGEIKMNDPIEVQGT